MSARTLRRLLHANPNFLDLWIDPFWDPKAWKEVAEVNGSITKHKLQLFFSGLPVPKKYVESFPSFWGGFWGEIPVILVAKQIQLLHPWHLVTPWMSVFSTFRRCFSSTSIHSILVFRSIGRGMESESKRSDLFVPNRKMLFHQKKVQWSDKKIMFLDVFLPNGWDINDVIQSPEKYVCVFANRRLLEWSQGLWKSLPTQGTFHFYHKKPETIQTFCP